MSSSSVRPGVNLERSDALRSLPNSGPQLVIRSDLEGLPVLHLLVVDEDDSVRDACAEIARRMGFAVTAAAGSAAAKEILKHQKIDVLLLEIRPADGDLALIEDLKAMQEKIEVIVMSASASVSSAVEAMRTGAKDYLTKPFSLDELVAMLERAGENRQFDLESRRLRERLRASQSSPHLIGQSPEMEKLYRILAKAANSSHPVLILGEAGTGKELVARSIHFQGSHSQRPFVPVDCGSLSPELIATELFGYVRGACPGGNRIQAQTSRVGLLSQAEGGTLFLDEIDALPLDLQGKLLRALQERQVTPLGASQPVPITARVLAATARDLAGKVALGHFRKDLYFRLNVVTLRIPPLRERRDDIPSLAQHFLERQSGKALLFSDGALHTLMAYEWPGNVRELEAAVARACAMSSGPVLQTGDLPTQLHTYRRNARPNTSLSEPQEQEPDERDPKTPDPRFMSIADLEREAILATIRQLKGDKLMAAKLLGIGKTTLYRKLKEYGVTGEFAEA